MQNLIGTFINGAISAYMIDVKKNDISGSITQKNLDISQLEIFPDALLQHNIPLLIKHGSIKNISIQMPTKFKTDPIKISIDSVTILCNLCSQDPTRDTLINMKIHMLKAYKYFRKCYKLIIGLISNHSILSIFRTIISNVIIEINHIHVQIEYSTIENTDKLISSTPLKEPNLKISNFEENSQNSEQNDTDIDDDSSFEDYSDLDSDEFVTANINRFSIYDTSKNNVSNEEKVTSIGIIIPKLILHNPEDLEKVSNKKIIKEAVFTDLNIYLDADQTPIDVSSKEKCENELLNLYNNKKHNWILEPFSFTGLIKFNKDDPRIFFEPIIEKVLLNIKEDCIPLIIDFIKIFDSFQKKISIAQISKPSFDDPDSLWMFCHKCAVSKISNATFDFSKSLSLLLKRAIFLKNYKKKNPKSQAIIKKMQENLDYSTIIAFRIAYRLTHKKRKEKGKSKITAKTTKKIIKEIRIDPVHIVTKIVTNFALNFSGKLLTINLKKVTDKEHIIIDVKNPHFMIEKDLKSYLIKASASYECVKYKKKKEIIVFNSIDNDQVEMKLEMIIPFLSYSNWSISLYVSRNNYTFNLDGFLQLLTDLNLQNLFQSDINRTNILAFIKHRKIEINIQVLSSVIKVLGSQNNRAVQYAFDDLTFSTDTKTFEKTLKLNNSWISLITDTEAKISSDFSLIGSLIGDNVSLNIPLFSCSIPFKYIVVIQDFINVFMKYQVLFRTNIFPKISVKFILKLKGMNINIKIPNSNQYKSLQIRNISLKFKDSVFRFKLKTIEMTDLLSLNNIIAIYDQENLNCKISEISTKVMDLLELVPKDALQIIQTQNDNNNQISGDISNSDLDSISEKSFSSQGKGINLPKIKIGLIIERFTIELSITSKDLLKIYLKDINSQIDNNKLITYALLDQITFEDLIISKQISYQSEVIFDQITKISMQTNNCNLDINKNLILMLFKVNFPHQEIALPHDVGINLSFKIDQMSISNDLIMKNFSSDLFFINSKIDVSICMDSISSSIVKFKSNDVLKMNVDIKQHFIDLAFNLEEIQFYVIPLVDIISFLSSVKVSTVQNKLNIQINPIKFIFNYGEDNVNAIFESPLKIKLDTFDKIVPYIYLKIRNFSINLNDNEVIGIPLMKFILDKNTVIKIPSLYITVSIAKIYKLLKIITVFTKSSFAKAPKKIFIYKLPIESITTKSSFIQIIIHQTKSRRNLSLILDNTEFYLKNYNQKAEMLAQTNIHFTASNGFTTRELAPSFKIIANGEISENNKNCEIKSENPIKFEISTGIIHEILKNITATENEIEQPYSIVNETGVDITILINTNEYSLNSNDHLPNITHFAESDIKVKIDDIINPIQIVSSFSKISFPLFFRSHFILVYLDPIRLQLRLLSPISFKNNSNVNLIILFLDQTISLNKSDTFYLNYKIEKLDSIIVGDDKNQQKIDLNKKSEIKLGNKYIIISKNRKIDTLHTIISFDAPYYFRNELLSVLTLSIENENNNIEYVILKPCEIVPVPFFSPSSKTISFDILDTNEIKGIHVELNFDDLINNKIFISTTDKKGNQFTFQFSYNNDTMNIISISPFLIYFSSLPIPLIFSLSPNEEIKIDDDDDDINLDDSVNSFFEASSQNEYIFNNPIMISPLVKETKNIEIYISTKYSEKWAQTPISLTNIEKTKDISVPFINDNVSLVHCHSFEDSLMSPNTFIFFITPQFLFHNQTNETFSLNLFDGNAIDFTPNSVIPVSFIRDSLEFSIAIVPKSNTKNLIYSNNININKISSQYVKVNQLDSPVLLRLSIEKEIRFITFLLNTNLPYLFVNNTDYKIIFIQKNTADSSHTVLPKKSLPFYLYDENMPTIIYCEIKDQVSFEIDVNQLSFPVKINENMNLYYYVDLSANEGSTITLCNVVNNTINITKNLNSITSEYFTSYSVSHFDPSSVSFNLDDISRLKDDVFNLTLNFDYFSFLIITNKNKELCRLTIKDIKINSSLNDFVTKTQVSFGTIKIDDQNKYAVYPSVFQILPKKEQPAIQLKVKSFGCNKYGKIELEICPIYIHIDLSFLSDLIGDIFYSNYLIHDKVIENKYSNLKFEINDIPLYEIINNLMPNQINYHINSILIHPFLINLSFHTVTKRSSHPLQQNYKINRFINFIPSFDNVTISITDSHCFRNLSGTSYEVTYKITSDIKRMILSYLSTKNPICGTKERIKDVFESFTQHQILKKLSNGIKNKIILVFSFVESTLFYISSSLDILVDSPPKMKTDETSISLGISSFILSFKEGISNILTEPIKRGFVDGKRSFYGFFIGTGIGITKFTGNVISGFCYLSASMFSSIKRFLGHEKTPVLIYKRECEPSFGMHCPDDEQLVWYAKTVCSGLIEVYTHSVFISNENAFIQDIIKVEINKTTVIVYDINNRAYNCSLNDENQAIFFYNVVQSVILKKKMLENNDVLEK